MTTPLVPPRTYAVIFIALLALTALTTFVAFFNLGPFNIITAMAIAVVKGVLVMLFFMHLRYSERLVWVFVGAGCFWLALLIALTLSDFLTRAAT